MFLTARKALIAIITIGGLFLVGTLYNLEQRDLYSQLEKFQKLKEWSGSSHLQKQQGDHKENNDNVSSHHWLDWPLSTPLVDNSPKSNPWHDKIDEPNGPLVRSTDQNYQRVNATFISLVRNSEKNSMIGSIRQIEATFNSKFHYPWVFFNDKKFLPGFKEAVEKIVSGPVTFVQIDPQDWEEPEWINRTQAIIDGKKMLKDDNVQHAEQTSYKRMCRWNSGKFFEHPVMQQYKYYWRVEPKTLYYCDIDYDVFAFMEQRELDYGFVLNIYDAPQSVRSLWPTVKQFFDMNPDYVHPNNSLQWLTQNRRQWHHEQANGYSTCHFWSNFEIGSLDFFRSQKYREYFEYLDKAGGFFHERWGDAPVHSVALGLMTDRAKIHWFKDIGYYHGPYYHCPLSDKCNGCIPGKFAPSQGMNKENCMNEWFKVAGAEWM